MEVSLYTHTNMPDILYCIGHIAGASTAKSGAGNTERALRCIEMGHHSILEHVSFTWYIEGISRACSHQLVRHRMASYTQESQRYTRVDFCDNDWYVLPPSFTEADKIHFKRQMEASALAYESALVNGIKPEDARYLLPNATKTNIYVTMNLREFVNFYKLRAEKHAQWEIRELAEKMLKTILEVYPELDILSE